MLPIHMQSRTPRLLLSPTHESSAATDVARSNLYPDAHSWRDHGIRAIVAFLGGLAVHQAAAAEAAPLLVSL